MQSGVTAMLSAPTTDVLSAVNPKIVRHGVIDVKIQLIAAKVGEMHAGVTRETTENSIEGTSVVLGVSSARLHMEKGGTASVPVPSTGRSTAASIDAWTSNVHGPVPAGKKVTSPIAS